MKIMKSLSVSNALSILFGYTYHCNDLKSQVLQHVVGHLGKMYEGDQDLFEEDRDHPEQQAPLAKVLKLMMKRASAGRHGFSRNECLEGSVGRLAVFFYTAICLCEI